MKRTANILKTADFKTGKPLWRVETHQDGQIVGADYFFNYGAADHFKAQWEKGSSGSKETSSLGEDNESGTNEL